MSSKKNKKRYFSWIKDYHRVSIINTLFTILFNLLPFWIGILLVLSVGRWTDWSKFYNNGEFYLYTTSFASSAYLIYHNYRFKPTDWKSIFSLLSMFLILITSILYASLASNPEPQVNTFIKGASIIGVICAVLLYYYSQVISNRNSPNIMDYRKDEQETIIQGLK